MIIRPMKHLLLPLLATGLTLAMGASLCAGDTTASLQINFGSAPHWTSVSGTRVEEIRDGDRPNYDMFRYGGSYYVYNNDRWYSSNQERGQFNLIDDRQVPGDFARIPRDHWRNYPSAWQDPSADDRYQRTNGSSASLQINFGSAPHWTSVYGTRVEEIRDGDRPQYDMFRYGGTYYVYNNDRWYSSDRDRGQFDMIEDRLVPSDFSRIPRDHWRNYPSAWQNQDSDPRYQGSRSTSASLQINFGSAPHWTSVYGTRVEEIRDGDRPQYDMFRYGGTYYVYNNDRWYSSDRERGQFDMIEDRLVPADFSRIPRDHWRSYPSAWVNQNNYSRYQGSRGTSGSLQISFGNRPRWSSIYGTRVQMIGGDQYPDYDVFRYGGSYYAFNNDCWYMSRRPYGQFNLIDARFVPMEFTRIPRRQWHNYPTAWMDQNGHSRYDNYDRRHNRGRYAQPEDQHDNN